MEMKARAKDAEPPAVTEPASGERERSKPPLGTEVTTQGRELPKNEELGTLGLPGLRLVFALCMVNFAMYVALYLTGMYVNIFVTSGVNTITIDDPLNIIHMVFASLNFALTFLLMMVGFVYRMKKVAYFGLGAVVSLSVGAVGGLLFLSGGGSRVSGGDTLVGGWIMSFVMLLAIFLSYFAALKVMRAVRVLEVFLPEEEKARSLFTFPAPRPSGGAGGDLGTMGGLSTSRSRGAARDGQTLIFTIYFQALFLALSYVVGVYIALQVSGPTVTTPVVILHGLAVSMFSLLTALVALLAVVQRKPRVAGFNAILFLMTLLAGVAGFSFLGNPTDLGSAGIANLAMIQVVGVGMLVTTYSLVTVSRDLGGRPRRVDRPALTMAYLAVGSLAMTLIAGVAAYSTVIISGAISSSLLLAHFSFAALTLSMILGTLIITIVGVAREGFGEGSNLPLPTRVAMPLLALTLIAIVAGSGGMYVLTFSFTYALGMAQMAILVYATLLLSAKACVSTHAAKAPTDSSLAEKEGGREHPFAATLFRDVSLIVVVAVVIWFAFATIYGVAVGG